MSAEAYDAAGEDSYVASSSPGANYGSSNKLTAGYRLSDIESANDYWYGLLRFDLAAIPGDAVITQATLTLSCAMTVGQSASLVALPLNATWSESGVTWNNRPDIISVPSVWGTLSGSAYAAYQFDVLAFVQGWKNGSLANHGFHLELVEEASDRRADGRSSDYTTAADRPKLTIHWHKVATVTRSTYSLAGPTHRHPRQRPHTDCPHHPIPSYTALRHPANNP